MGKGAAAAVRRYRVRLYDVCTFVLSSGSVVRYSPRASSWMKAKLLTSLLCRNAELSPASQPLDLSHSTIHEKLECIMPSTNNCSAEVKIGAQSTDALTF